MVSCRWNDGTITQELRYPFAGTAVQFRLECSIAEYVRGLTKGRVSLGPGTLYTILSTYQSEKVIEKVSSEGRRITYRITEKGEKLYADEVARLKSCLADAEENQ